MNNNKDNFELIKTKPKTEYEKYLEREKQLAQEWEERKERLLSGEDRFDSLTEDEIAYIIQTSPFSREYKIKGCDFEKLQKFNRLLECANKLKELRPEIFLDLRIFKPSKKNICGCVSFSLIKNFELKDDDFKLYKAMVECSDKYEQCLVDENEVVMIFEIENIYTGDVIKETYL